MGYIHPAVSEICDPQSLDPICDKFDKFLAHGQAHMGQMGEWPRPCTTRGLDNSTELRMEKIHQAVTEICVPQIWQPPAHPPGQIFNELYDNAGLRKRLRSCPNEYASQLWHQLKRYFSIHHINGAFLMNVSRKHVKRSLKIEFCDNLKTHDLC